MERIILMILRRIYIAPFWFYQICRYGKSETYTEKERYELIHKIVKKANKAGKIEVECYGKENIPKEDGFIMFPNHQGLFDVLGIIECTSRPFTFVAKDEIKNNLFLKKIVRLLKAQIMDRKDIRQSLKVINKMTEEVKSGRNYVIFSEGTRSKNKNELLEFKSGSFKSAVNAKCPILPVAIIDSYKVFDSHNISRTKVKICFLEPLLYEDYSNLKTVEIANIVKKRIEENIYLNSEKD